MAQRKFNVGDKVVGNDKKGTFRGRKGTIVKYESGSRVRLVVDNLNTHCLASLYETFEPQDARRLAQRIEIHYTPKHGRDRA